MSGHSKWSTIKRKKGAADAKRGKVFTKLIREITVAARAGGGDPDGNPRLRTAILAAKAENMPKDNIDRAIKRAIGGDDATQYEEIRYEGYGPGGVAIIVEALTDNRKRTASEIRAAFSKYGGTLGETNSVSFMFDRVGLIRFERAVGTAEAVFEAAVEAGASNAESSSDGHEVTCMPDDFSTVRDSLADRFGDPEEARLAWLPQTTIEVDEEQAESLLKLLDTLDDKDDVQQVSANFEIAEETMTRLTA
jgi:YebC/PmpR family DNA-binding regulatory protein